VLPALVADTACNVGGIRTVLEILPAGCRQRSIECCRPREFSRNDSERGGARARNAIWPHPASLILKWAISRSSDERSVRADL
jgi:hypothetical protein